MITLRQKKNESERKRKGQFHVWQETEQDAPPADSDAPLFDVASSDFSASALTTVVFRTVLPVARLNVPLFITINGAPAGHIKRLNVARFLRLLNLFKNFATIDGNVVGRFNPQLNLVAADVDNHDANVAINKNALIFFA